MAELPSHWRDIGMAAAVVATLIIGLTLYTSNWPPVVVVESNSMMHVDVQAYQARDGAAYADDVGFGRLGTIDPGDLVLVKDVDRLSDVKTWAEGGDGRYKRSGDVIVYRPNGGTATYTAQWAESWGDPSAGDPNVACQEAPAGNRTCTFRARDGGLTISSLGIHGMRPLHSGIITKGDNGATNTQADQVIFPEMRDRPVKAEWINGVARAEIPWFGLIKLSLTRGTDAGCAPVRNCEMGRDPYFVQIGYIIAPRDLWIMLVVALAVVIGGPIVVDVGWARYKLYQQGHNGDPVDDAPDETADQPVEPEPPEPEPTQADAVEEDAEDWRPLT